MKQLTILFSIFFISLSLTTCKKGENDPSISLLSRKARVVGEWRMKEGDIGFTILQPGKSGISYFLKLDGSAYSGAETPAGSVAYIYVGRYSLHMSFKKDGSFKVDENWDGKILSASGTWDFAAGMGDAKSKESLIIVLESIANGETNANLFNKFNTEFTYKISGLRNTEMTIESGTATYLSSKGERETFENHYVLVQ